MVIYGYMMLYDNSIQFDNQKESQKVEMIKSDNPYGMGGQPTSKKIQNYIFKFSDMIGQGNFSKVYKAHHQLTNEVVAIKIIQLNSLKSKKLEELLFSQIDVLKKLNHPNILKCYEVFTSNRNCYIITQLCNGGDLQSQLRKVHHFKQSDAQPIIRDIFGGLLYLAEKNVIHRDLKVANIFLHNGRAKIADFGFAKFTKEKFKDINIGSPIYMSPQGLINNYYGPKTDIWAFGILIYELLHGETPYAFCQTENQLKYHISVPITWSQIKADVSNEIKQVILRCMEVQQEKRGSALELKNTGYLRKLLNQYESDTAKKNYQSPNKPYEPPIESNYLNSVQSPSRREQLIDKRRNILSSGNDKRFSPMSINQNRNLSSKNIKRIENNLNNHANINKKGFSTQKFTLNKPQEQQNTVSVKKTTNRSLAIVSSITFKQSVNILHYCRLLYKYILALKQTPYSDPHQISKLSTWLMKLLKEINDKIENKQIIYEGENIWLREKKLKEVSTQYTKKYTSELGSHSSNIYNHQMNLEHMRKYFHTIFEHIDTLIAREKNKQLLLLGHSIVMINDATKILNKCSEDGNYKAYGQYKDIESFLNMNKDTMDIHSYMLFRKKLTYDKE